MPGMQDNGGDYGWRDGGKGLNGLTSGAGV